MRIFYLSALCLILLVSTSLSLTSSQNIHTNPLEALSFFSKDYPKAPVLKDTSYYPVISAQGALAVDLDSSVVLYEKEPDQHLLPASTTKIITALVAMDYYPKDKVITVVDPYVDGQKMGLVVGEKISVNDLFYGLLVFSANDAAEVLANNYPGGRGSFVAAMNIKAKQLNLTNSHFENPTGLDGVAQYTSARDLIRVSQAAMQKPYFAQIVGTKSIVVKSTDGKIVHRLTNVNELLGKVEGVVGVKTGWTEEARENLVTYITRDGKNVMIAVLGSQDRFGETKELINWIYSNYEWQQVKLPSNTEKITQ